jgi:hypothetical protein
MIRKIWLQQPIAFARAGLSATPLDAFRWTEPDLRPRGSGRTTIAPGTTFEVDPGSGVLHEKKPGDFTLFRDKDGIRPVCPFFELHGDWDGRQPGESTALTQERVGSLSALTWHIHLANHKAFSLTHAAGDRVEAEMRISGADHARHDLVGHSPAGAPRPLVPRHPGIRMGAIQLVQPSDEQPQIRLRFFAPPGHAYGPTDLEQRLRQSMGFFGRLAALLGFSEDFSKFHLPADRCIVNPDAAWPQYQLLTYGEALRGALRSLRRLSSARTLWSLARYSSVQQSQLLRFLMAPTRDVGRLPPGTYAWRPGKRALLSSLGLIDDLGDGIITCALANGCSATARIVVCPPHFSPDRRPPVSLADALTDRTRRADVRAPQWNEAGWGEAEAEIDDLLDRAFETSSASNLDAMADGLGQENASMAASPANPPPRLEPGRLLWPKLRNKTVLDLPLTEQGRWRHRRNSSDEFFEQLLRDTADPMKRWLRDPSDPQSLYYDIRMPALMRGPDRHPLHLTRRQLGAFRRWLERLRARAQRPQ